jgi:XTP/dITP diphosphohydrolase
MKTRILLATRNSGKIAELRAMLSDLDLEVLSLDEVPEAPEVAEDGATFRDNALKKAKAAADATGLMTLADDSGLEVDALNGSPGVYSARYAGDHADDMANNTKLLSELEGVPADRRSARFRCVIVVYHPSGRWIDLDGKCEGRIAGRPTGEQGFGYDPVFFLPGLGKTMAQLTPEEKNSLSHRGAAFKKLRKELPGFLKALRRNGQ